LQPAFFKIDKKLRTADLRRHCHYVRAVFVFGYIDECFDLRQALKFIQDEHRRRWQILIRAAMNDVKCTFLGFHGLTSPRLGTPST